MALGPILGLPRNEKRELDEALDATVDADEKKDLTEKREPFWKSMKTKAEEAKEATEEDPRSIHMDDDDKRGSVGSWLVSDATDLSRNRMGPARPKATSESA